MLHREVVGSDGIIGTVLAKRAFHPRFDACPRGREVVGDLVAPLKELGLLGGGPFDCSRGPPLYSPLSRLTPHTTGRSGSQSHPQRRHADSPAAVVPAPSRIATPDRSDRSGRPGSGWAIGLRSLSSSCLLMRHLKLGLMLTLNFRHKWATNGV